MHQPLLLRMSMKQWWESCRLPRWGRLMAARRRDSRSTGEKPEKDWITSGEVARALNMTDAAIRRWAREGLVAAIKTPGGQYRFRREAVSDLMKSRTVVKRPHPKKPSSRGATR